VVTKDRGLPASEATPAPPEWVPDPAQIRTTNLFQLVEREGMSDPEALWERALNDPAWFWGAVTRQLGLLWSRPYDTVFEPTDAVPGGRWFSGGELNAAFNCLDRHVQAGRGDHTAVIADSEQGTPRRLSYAHLLAETNRLANGLRELGVRSGDRVGLMLPMSEHAAIAMLACARLGAIVCPAFSGLGPDALASRFGDCGVVAVLTADTAVRRGQRIDLVATVRQASGELPSLRSIIVVRRSPAGSSLSPYEVDYRELVDRQLITFAGDETRADHPLMILYTSGTTGRPKGVVQSHAEFLVKAGEDLLHAFDVRGDDVVFWLTDPGWIMAPILIFGGLLLGATIVLYEGAPDQPDPGRLWRLVEDHGVTIFGGSPSLTRLLRPHGTNHLRQRDLRSIRIIGSTGEPIDLESWDWLFREVGEGRAPIINYSGGTEVGGGILGCFPVFAQRPCAFARPFPGMDADVFDSDGRPIRGRMGELVVKSPWPGQARTFWGDHERYVDTYWSRWSGVWVHGDAAMIDAIDDWYIVGRSDDTFNVAGHRVGPAELEAIILNHEGIKDAVVVGLEDLSKGHVPAAFVVSDIGAARDPDSLLRTINKRIVSQLGPTLRLASVWIVPDLPRTRNGKISRTAVRDAFQGKSSAIDRTVFDDPTSLATLAELGATYRSQAPGTSSGDALIETERRR